MVRQGIHQVECRLARAGRHSRPGDGDSSSVDHLPSRTSAYGASWIRDDDDLRCGVPCDTTFRRRSSSQQARRRMAWWMSNTGLLLLIIGFMVRASSGAVVSTLLSIGGVLSALARTPLPTFSGARSMVVPDRLAVDKRPATAADRSRRPIETAREARGRF
jgi:hypothetical protein